MVWVFFNFYLFITVFIINKILSGSRYQRAHNFPTYLNLITNCHLLLKLNPLLLHLRLLLLFSLVNQLRFPQVQLLQLILTINKLILVVQMVPILELACFLQSEQLVGVSGLAECEFFCFIVDYLLNLSVFVFYLLEFALAVKHVCQQLPYSQLVVKLRIFLDSDCFDAPVVHAVVEIDTE